MDTLIVALEVLVMSASESHPYHLRFSITPFEPTLIEQFFPDYKVSSCKIA